VYFQGILGWKFKKNTNREVVFRKEIPKKTHDEENGFILDMVCKIYGT
jgi:hypothetical protein